MERPKFPVGSPQCWCTVCGRTFLSPDAFDIHRGIDHEPESDNEQGFGECADFLELYALGLEYDEPSERWGTPEDMATLDKMAEVRSKGESKRTAQPTSDPGEPATGGG